MLQLFINNYMLVQICIFKKPTISLIKVKYNIQSITLKKSMFVS